MTKIGNSKHNRLCELLADTLWDRYQYTTVTTNIEYPLGEVDVLARNDYREVYYEVKSSIKDKHRDKAVSQLLRWTRYQYDKDNSKNYYGVYCRPGRTELICKNGKTR